MWNMRWCLEIHGGPRAASNTQCIVTVSVKSGCRPVDKFLGAVRDPVGTVQARGLKTLGGHLRTCGQRRGVINETNMVLDYALVQRVQLINEEYLQRIHSSDCCSKFSTKGLSTPSNEHFARRLQAIPFVQAQPGQINA